MKQISFILGLAGLFMMISISSCNDEPINNSLELSSKELTLYANVDGVSSHATRTTDNYGFAFVEGDTVDLWVNGEEKARKYSFENHMLSGSTEGDKFYFSIDNRPINTLVSQWPTAFGREDFPTFQGSEEEFKRADWLRAEMDNVQATGTSIPIHYKHENSRLVFELPDYAGSLSALSLQIGYDTYEGYIPSEMNRSELILRPALITINASHNNNYILVDNVPMPLVFTSNITINMLAGYSYVITLTRKGDNLNFRISIHGFSNSDNEIAVPFERDADGYFPIEAEHQLRAARSLATKYLWHYEKFKLVNDIVLTSEWQPIEAGLFSGEFDLNGYSVTLFEDEENEFLFSLPTP